MCVCLASCVSATCCSGWAKPFRWYFLFPFFRCSVFSFSYVRLFFSFVSFVGGGHEHTICRTEIDPPPPPPFSMRLTRFTAGSEADGDGDIDEGAAGTSESGARRTNHVGEASAIRTTGASISVMIRPPQQEVVRFT